MSKKPSSKRERTRLHILQHAAKQFAKYGYTGISMDAMAATMKLTKGALYGHFKGKQDIFIQSTTWYIDQAIASKMQGGFSGSRASEKLDDYLSWLLDIMETDNVFRQLMLRLLTDSDLKTARIIAKKVFIKPFDSLISLIQESYPEKDAAEYAYSLFSIAILSHDIKKVAATLSPKTKNRQSTPALLHHFQEIMN